MLAFRNQNDRDDDKGCFLSQKKQKYLHSKRGGCSMKLVKRAVVKSGVWDTLIWQ